MQQFNYKEMRSYKFSSLLILMIFALFAACSSKQNATKSTLDGTYMWQNGYKGDDYIAFIKNDSISFFRRNNCDKFSEKSCHDSITVLIASGILTRFYNGGIEINSTPNNPFKDTKYSFSPARGDSAKVILKFPNYDFSHGVFPIMKITAFYGDIAPYPEYPDYIEEGMYEMVIECKSDSVVASLPRIMMQETLYLDLTQSTYINKNSLRAYLGELKFHSEVSPDLEDHPDENIILTFPNITNQAFELLCLDNFRIAIEDDYLYFLNWDMRKISSDIITSWVLRRHMYDRIMYSEYSKTEL